MFSGAEISGSVAVLVTTSVVNSLIVRLACPGRINGLVTTTTVNWLVALRWVAFTATRLVSVTTVINKLVLGTCAAEGDQVMTPEELIAALVGPFTKV